MRARAGIARTCATVYVKASMDDKRKILDELCPVTGWSRLGARRRLART